jgi:4-hydroxy-4-methyl-2-oxoglutarate aldolase
MNGARETVPVGRVRSRPAGSPDSAARARRLGVANLAAAASDRSQRPCFITASALPRVSGAGAVAGYATTVWNPAGHNSMTWFGVEAGSVGDLLVITSPDTSVAQWGAMASAAAQARGICGVVVDGAVRDVGACRDMGFSVWAKSINPSDPAKRLPGFVNEPVDAAGVAIAPGDLIVADDDGVLVIARAAVEECLAVGELRAAEEETALHDLRLGRVTGYIALRLDHLSVERLEPLTS